MILAIVSALMMGIEESKPAKIARNEDVKLKGV
jgi:hypothetical protein